MSTEQKGEVFLLSPMWDEGERTKLLNVFLAVPVQDTDLKAKLREIGLAFDPRKALEMMSFIKDKVIQFDGSDGIDEVRDTLVSRLDKEFDFGDSVGAIDRDQGSTLIYNLLENEEFEDCPEAEIITTNWNDFDVDNQFGLTNLNRLYVIKESLESIRASLDAEGVSISDLSLFLEYVDNLIKKYFAVDLAVLSCAKERLGRSTVKKIKALRRTIIKEGGDPELLRLLDKVATSPDNLVIKRVERLMNTAPSGLYKQINKLQCHIWHRQQSQI
jgi:uncharacterized protein YlaN (UPF0358 family)